MSQKITDFKPTKTNPFVKDLVGGMNNKPTMIKGTNQDSFLVVNPRSGEVEGQSVFMKVKMVDAEKFTKVYVSSLKHFFDLGQKEIRVLSYIMEELKPNHGQVYIHTQSCADYTGYSRVTVTKAIASLLSMKFIARSEHKHFFFINPQIFFNGDRISFVTQYRKKQEEETMNVIEESVKALEEKVEPSASLSTDNQT